MTPAAAEDAAFYISALAVLPMYAAMVLGRGSALTHRLLRFPHCVVVPSLCYVVVLCYHTPELLTFLTSSRIDRHSFAALAGTTWGATMWWSHAGAFDLMAARWIYYDALAARFSHVLLVAVLAVTIVFGPLGLCLYVLLRLVV